MATTTATPEKAPAPTQKATATLPVAPAASDAPKPRFESQFAELDELDRLDPTDKGGKPAPAVPAKPAAQEPPKPGKDAKPPAAPAKPDPKAAAPAKPGEQPKPGEKPPEVTLDTEPDPAAKFQLAHDLRKEFRRLHKANQEQEAELAKLRASAKPGEDPEAKALRDQNQAMRARMDEMEKELRYLDYTKSDEFKSKFEKPFQDGLADAYEEVKEFWVTTEDGSQRPANAADFDRILEAAPQEVREKADKLFGEYKNDVLALRRRLVDLRKNADREAKRYREEAKTREQQRITEAGQQKAMVEQLWTQANKAIVDRYPQFFGEVEGDDEINTALRASYEYIDRQLSPNVKLEDKIAAQAAIRHRAAAFKPMLIRNQRLTARVKELEEALAEYEKSAPGEGSRTGTEERVNGTPGFVSAADEIDKLAAGEPE